jgi:hypothetical protein
MIDHIFTQTREEAVEVGQMLLNHGALRHASLQGAPFADGRQLYQFLVRHPPRAPTTPNTVVRGGSRSLTKEDGDSTACSTRRPTRRTRVGSWDSSTTRHCPTDYGTPREGKHVRGRC